MLFNWLIFYERSSHCPLSRKTNPSDWKYANVTAIPKKEKVTTPGDHRPISLLNYCGKLMERSSHYKHVTSYLKQHSIIMTFHSGFQTGNSTVNQLLHMYNDFAKALDKGKEVGGVLLDISQAFDKVLHIGLIFKLRSIGISGNLIEWFTDYLAKRKQHVCLNSYASSWKKNKCLCPTRYDFRAINLHHIYLVQKERSVFLCNFGG